MKYWGNEHVFDYSWDTCTRAMWRKYPNEHSAHIKTVDVLDRKLDPTTGILSSVRLVSMQSALPGWLNSLFGSTQDDGFVYETSEVDPRHDSRRMTLKMRNMTFNNLVVVEETCTYTPHPDDPTKTIYTQECSISANFTMLAGKVEAAMLDKFMSTSKKGKDALEGVCQLIHTEHEALANMTA